MFSGDRGELGVIRIAEEIVCREPDLLDVAREQSRAGKICVEVLGENHTRAALQRLVKSSECTQKEKYQFVYMDVYQNLTQDQALFLAFKHNELHENSQELSFSEKVMFFHKLLLDCERKFAGQTKKLISTKWRSEIAAIMNKSVSNVYHNFIFTKTI